MKPAEMANSANYAAMNYGELLNTKNAFTWAIGFHIDPLLKTKRLEEMEKITRAYVTAMNGYDATREEIIACLEKVGMKESHMFSSPRKDDQTPSVNAGIRQNDGKSHLALPSPESSKSDLSVNADRESPEGDSSENDEAAEDDSAASSPEGDSHPIITENKDGVDKQMEPKSEDVVDALATVEQDSSDTNNMTPGMQAFVDEALEVLKALPAPDDIDVNAPYYVEGDFAYGDFARPGYSKPTWRNMGKTDLEAFRSATEKYEKLFLKHEVLASTDDYLVISESLNSIKVRMYHFPEEYRDGSESITTNDNSCHDLSKDEMKRRKMWVSLMRKAIKQAKEQSFSDGTDANTPFYDRYKFGRDGKILNLCGDRVRCYEDADTLSELMPSFETYARLYRRGSLVVSKDNCVANVSNGIIYLVLFNIPTQENKKRVAKKPTSVAKDITVVEESAPVSNVSTDQIVSNVIIKATEMSRALPVSKGTDVNTPYYVQQEYVISNDGGLFPTGKTFSTNFSIDTLDKNKASHRKLASAMKASALVSGNDYTAFVWNNGKNVCVYSYHV